MLTVYTYPVPRPANALDLSTIPLDELADAALAFSMHQSSGRVWFGYLDGWMLTPRDEVLLRKVLRKFECSLVTAFPLALSFAWKNEIATIYTADLNGAPSPHNNGRLVHDGSSPGYGHSHSHTSTHREDHQN